MTLPDKILIISAILIGIGSAIFSIITYINTRKKYYQDFLNDKKKTDDKNANE